MHNHLLRCSLFGLLAIGLSRADTINPLENPIVGEFQLQQSGNEITGDYNLTQQQTNQFLVVRPSDDEIIGRFELQQSGNSITGDFQMNHPAGDPNPDDFLLVQTETNQTLGTFVGTQELGNQISGDYQLVNGQASSASVPEPGTVCLFGLGIGCIVAGRLRPQKAGS
jgi:hypothetical protein